MRRLLDLAVLMLWCAPSALAQSPPPDNYPKLEAFAGYSAIGRTNSHVINFASFPEMEGLATATGFQLSTIGNLNKWFGLKADFSAHFEDDRARALVRQCGDCPTFPEAISFRTRLFESLGGPEVKARNNSRWTPFAHTMIGVANVKAKLDATGTPTDFSVKASNNAFAMAMGGGVDFRISTRFSLRGSIDYNPVFFGTSDTVANHRQDFVRFSVGVLFH